MLGRQGIPIPLLPWRRGRRCPDIKHLFYHSNQFAHIQGGFGASVVHAVAWLHYRVYLIILYKLRYYSIYVYIVCMLKVNTLFKSQISKHVTKL